MIVYLAGMPHAHNPAISWCDMFVKHQTSLHELSATPEDAIDRVRGAYPARHAGNIDAFGFNLERVS